MTQSLERSKLTLLLKSLVKATSFAEILKQASTLNPDIVLLDLHMPDELRYLPEIVKGPLLDNTGCILAISIWNDEKAKALAKNIGAVALLDKAEVLQGHQRSNQRPRLFNFMLSNYRYDSSRPISNWWAVSFGVVGSVLPPPSWKAKPKERCDQAAVEHDANKLLKLIQEIDKLLRLAGHCPAFSWKELSKSL